MFSEPIIHDYARHGVVYRWKGNALQYWNDTRGWRNSSFTNTGTCPVLSYDNTWAEPEYVQIIK